MKRIEYREIFGNGYVEDLNDKTFQNKFIYHILLDGQRGATGATGQEGSSSFIK